MSAARLVASVVGAAVVAAVGFPSPAAAHTVTGVSPTNYRSRIIGLFPPLPGVTARLLDLGNQIELTNRGEQEVVVMGYDGAPYLRVGPTGVFENRRSPTVEQNRAGATTPTATSTTSPAVVPAAPPAEWRRISSGQTAKWRDHRTRWEGPDPPAVRAAPDREHVVSQWQVALRQDDRAAAVTGRITWVPGPSAIPWLLLALGLALATVAAAFSPHWGWWLSAAVAVLVAVDVVNSFAAEAADDPSLGQLLLSVLVGGFISTVGWVVGALAIGPLQRARPAGLFGAGLSGLLLGLYALPGALAFGRSQVPTAVAAVVARAGTATVLGLGLGVVVAVVVVFRRQPELLVPSDEPQDERPGHDSA